MDVDQFQELWFLCAAILIYGILIGWASTVIFTRWANPWRGRHRRGE